LLEIPQIVCGVGLFPEVVCNPMSNTRFSTVNGAVSKLWDQYVPPLHIAG